MAKQGKKMFLRNYRNKGKVNFQHSQKDEVYKKTKRWRCDSNLPFKFPTNPTLEPLML